MTVPANRAQVEYLRAQYGDKMCFFSEMFDVPVADVNFTVPARKMYAQGAGNIYVRLLGDTADTLISATVEGLQIDGLAIIKIAYPSTTARRITVFW